MKLNAVPTLIILMMGLFLMPQASHAQATYLKVNTDIFPQAEKGYKQMVIEGIEVVAKRGGKSDYGSALIEKSKM